MIATKTFSGDGWQPSGLPALQHTPGMRTFLVSTGLLFAVSAQAQVADATNGMVAGIPVNYTEAKVGTYTLPDPLTLANGQSVRDAKTWFEKRRPEIVRLFEENQFGSSPGRSGRYEFRRVRQRNAGVRWQGRP